MAGDTNENQGGEGWYVIAGVWYAEERSKTGQGRQVGGYLESSGEGRTLR